MWALPAVGLVALAVFVVCALRQRAAAAAVRLAHAALLEELTRAAERIAETAGFVRRYAESQTGLLDALAAGPERLTSAAGITPQAAAWREIESAFAQEIGLLPEYPEMRANADFRELRERIDDARARVQRLIADYNAAAATLNRRVSGLVGGAVGMVCGRAGAAEFAAAGVQSVRN